MVWRLSRGLLWNDAGTVESTSYRAPSWSWASRDIVQKKVGHPSYGFSPMDDSIWEPYQDVVKTITLELPANHKLHLVEYSKTCDSSNGFSSINSASITLSATCLVRKANSTASTQQMDADDQPTRDAAETATEQASNHPMLRVANGEAIHPREDEEITNVLVSRLRGYQSSGVYFWALRVSCDRVLPDGSRVYRRVGTTKFNDESAWFRQTWERRIISIF
jgi:hypothetical protein